MISAPASSEPPNLTLPLTLLSRIHKFNSLEALSSRAPHPFATNAESSSALLQELVHATDELLHSSNMYLVTPMSDPKLVSILRQQVAISQSLHLSDQSINQSIDMLRKRSNLLYGEDIPLDKSLVVQWCISRLKTLCSSTGMESFADEEREGRMTMVLGGKVIVIDIDFFIDRTDPLVPRIDVVGAKTSYAVPNDLSSAATEASAFLDTLLAESVKGFCTEVQRSEEIRQPKEAARLGQVVVQHLNYLMTLDKLAMGETGGIRWFVDMLDLGSLVGSFARNEAESVASSLSITQAPLDIFLHRSHALPLLCLNSPSISFLIYLSPLAYLTLKHSFSSSSSDQSGLDLLPFDIPVPYIKEQLSVHSRLRGATVATLSLSPFSDPPLYPPALPRISPRPSFPLVLDTPEIDHVFPQAIDSGLSLMEQPNIIQGLGQHTWILDFTDGGKYQGVVMSQSRMRDMELIVNPLSAIDHLGTAGILPFASRSWVDVLLNPTVTMAGVRYTTVHYPPTSLHPPLRLVLSPPDEPGFLLERVRVNNIKEVWGILEIVREQCWLNEILDGYTWEIDSLNARKDDIAGEEITQELLQAMLAGNVITQKIPVNIYLPSHSEPPNPLFDPTPIESISMHHSQSQHPKILMTFPERSLSTGLVEVTVAYDETCPRGISVDIRGALGADVNADALEERCRRGGVLGLAGKIWEKSLVA